MAGGLFALLDDVAALARVAAASVDDVGAAAGRASMKAAGVVVDDTAVTPQYVRGVAAKRELPIIRKIALGSIINKLVVILPIALLLSQFFPQALMPILMVGGTYLCFEGVEKVWEKVSGSGHAEETETLSQELTPEQEKTTVRSAIRTDLILSAEIMVISLNEVASEPLMRRAMILVVVALVITVVVYGVVALIVKMDDVGLALAERKSALSQRVGKALVQGMPTLLKVISVVGTAAMIWVGGHILLIGFDAIGWSAPYDLVHHAEVAVKDALAGTGAFASAAAWVINTIASAILGLIVGAIVVTILHFLPGRKHEDS